MGPLHLENIIRRSGTGSAILPHYLPSEFSSPKEIFMMIENFDRLKLLNVSYDSYLTDPIAYQHFYYDEKIKTITNKIFIRPNSEIAHIRGVATVTDLGLSFYNICVK